MRDIKFWVVLCVVMLSQNTFAALSKSDLATLPRYCDPNYRKTMKWTHGLGLHHYCNGLSHLNKYYTARSKNAKQTHYRQGVAEINYHLEKNKRTLTRNPLVAEMYYNRGKLHALGGKSSDALRDWYKAIEIKPKLRRAYLDLASYLKRNGQKDEALKVVTAGLRHIPKSKALKKRYVELGGKLPYPEPLVSKQKR